MSLAPSPPPPCCQVYRVQRVKVREALQAAGLLNTQAGKQAVALAKPAQATRPDNLTYLQRGGGGPGG